MSSKSNVKLFDSLFLLWEILDNKLKVEGIEQNVIICQTDLIYYSLSLFNLYKQYQILATGLQTIFKINAKLNILYFKLIFK